MSSGLAGGAFPDDRRDRYIFSERAENSPNTLDFVAYVLKEPAETVTLPFTHIQDLLLSGQWDREALIEVFIAMPSVETLRIYTQNALCACMHALLPLNEEDYPSGAVFPNLKSIAFADNTSADVWIGHDASNVHPKRSFGSVTLHTQLYCLVRARVAAGMPISNLYFHEAEKFKAAFRRQALGTLDRDDVSVVTNLMAEDRGMRRWKGDNGQWLTNDPRWR